MAGDEGWGRRQLGGGVMKERRSAAYPEPHEHHRLQRQVGPTVGHAATWPGFLQKGLGADGGSFLRRGTMAVAFTSSHPRVWLHSAWPAASREWYLSSPVLAAGDQLPCAPPAGIGTSIMSQ